MSHYNREAVLPLRLLTNGEQLRVGGAKRHEHCSHRSDRRLGAIHSKLASSAERLSAVGKSLSTSTAKKYVSKSSTKYSGVIHVPMWANRGLNDSTTSAERPNSSESSRRAQFSAVFRVESHRSSFSVMPPGKAVKPLKAKIFAVTTTRISNSGCFRYKTTDEASLIHTLTVQNRKMCATK